MKRRDLIRLSLASTAVGILAPGPSLADSASCEPASAAMAGGVFHTKDAPGRWAGKEASHTPNIEVTKKDGAVSVKVVTGHEIDGFVHYIVKHVLLDKDYQFIGENMFDPSKEYTAVSTFEFDEGYSGTIYALSVCNKHDTWIDSAEV